MNVFRYGQAEVAYLREQDRRLGQAIERIGMIERPVIPDMFTALISSIVHQQISNKAAATVWSRVIERFGPILPEVISSTALKDIQQCGMSLRKAGYIQSIARAVVSRELILPELNQLSDDEVIQKLSGLPGVGVWTAEMLMIFSMQRPDIVSWHDLAIRRGMMNLYGLPDLNRDQFCKIRQRYSPHGSVASLYLWQISKEA